MGRELEVKFKADAAIQAAIAGEYGPFRVIEMETTYYDTPQGTLSDRHITLRRRMENGVSVCTVKTPLADGSRGEWEVEWDKPETMVGALCAAGAPAELKALTEGGIIAVCGAKFTRRAADICLDGGTAELALDRGILIGGSRQMQLCEVEVELKSGSDEATLAFARQLAARFGLQEQPHSKFRRAMGLATGEI